jgi:tellurium resistance protein TerZ
MINLKKGSSINLEKDGKKLETMFLGLNWGKISKLWGLLQVNVDLDGSVTMFDKDKRVIDTVYFNKRRSNDSSIYHTGDDLTGDTYEDEKDNEIISINLKKVSPEIESIVVYLNSYKGQQFHTIPYAKIRLVDGNMSDSKKAFAYFDLASEPGFKGKVAMIMAKIVRHGDNWKFVAIGEPATTRSIEDTVKLIRHQYL